MNRLFGSLTKIGLSEFVVKKKSKVIIKSKQSTKDLIN